MSDLRTEKLSITVPGTATPMPAYLATPRDGGPYPAVLVLEEIFGVNEHIRSVVDRVAAEGYVAIAPDYHFRVSQGRELSYGDADRQIGMSWITPLKEKNTIEGDLRATIDYLGTRPDVRADRIGAMGFCIGGHMAFFAAAKLPIRATASFYGAGIAAFAPGGGPPTVTLAPQIGGRIICFFGAADPSIPPEHVKTVEDALRGAHVRHEIVVYPGVNHAFFRDVHPPTYDITAAADAWTRVKTLFAEELR
jgi:carboxymethylenebutenolidase